MKKLNLDIQMFSSTNKTTNYELPQFIGTDKPTWLGDFNEAMADIDAGMHENASDISAMASDVATASATASQASQDVSTLSSTVSSLSSDVSSATSTANNAQSTATSALNTANTANGKADTNTSAISGIDTRVTALENAKIVYSSNETLTNKVWIDNKPIYRKYMEITVANTGTQTISHNIGLESVTSFIGFCTINGQTVASHGWRVMPEIVGANEFSINAITTNDISFIVSGWTNNKAFIVLEYTKAD